MWTTIIWIVSAVVITLVITGTQKYLSTRKLWQLGALVPLITASIMVGLFYIMNIDVSIKTLLPSVLVIVLELIIWVDGRKACKRKELNKMKAKDI